MSNLSSARKLVRQDDPEPFHDIHAPLAAGTGAPFASSPDSQPVLGTSGPDDFGVELFEDETPRGASAPGANQRPSDAEPSPPELTLSDPDTVQSQPDSLVNSGSSRIAQMFDSFLDDPMRPVPIPASEQPRTWPLETADHPRPEMAAQPLVIAPSAPVKASVALERRTGRILSSGLLGAFGGCAVCVTLWLAGFKTPKPESFQDEGPALGTGEPERARPDEFAAIAKALELAREHKYADAVMAIEKAPLPAKESRSSPEALNRHELIEHWRVEERLHAAGYLSFIHRDAVAATERLLDDYHKVEQQLREAHVRLEKIPKPVDIKPLHQEIERLKEAKASAEARSTHVDAANRIANQALAQAKMLEEKLLLSEQKLRAAEEKLKQASATGPAFRNVEIAPAGFPETVSESRSAFEAYERGMNLYRLGNFAEAERELAQAVRGDHQDARYEYYLGLAALAQGKGEAAAQSFRRGAQLEHDNRPSQVFVLVALETVSGEARRELDRYRVRKN